MICPHCNTTVEDSSSFCMNCGAKLTAPEPQPQPQPEKATKTCPHCNHEVADTDAFCMSCGAQLSAPAQNTQYTAPAQSAPAFVPPAAPVAPVGAKYSGKAIAAFVLSLVSLVFTCAAPICGILAIIFAALGQKEINEKQLAGKGLAVAGLVMGIIAVVFSFFYYIVLFPAIIGSMYW